MNQHYAKDVDTSSRQAMVSFLKDHPRSYLVHQQAYLPKTLCHSLATADMGLDDEEGEIVAAYRMYCCADRQDSAPVFWKEIQLIIQDFQRATDNWFTISYTSPRPILTLMRRYKDGLREGELLWHHGEGNFDYDDEDEWDMFGLAEEVEFYRQFDEACDQIRAYIRLLAFHWAKTEIGQQYLETLKEAA